MPAGVADILHLEERRAGDELAVADAGEEGDAPFGRCEAGGSPRPHGHPGWTEPALLVLDDGRYVLGATPDGPPPDGNASAPLGEAVTQPLPSPKPARAVGPYVLWQPHIHKPGIIAFGVAFLSVCLIAAGIGYGNTAALGICLAAAALGPAVGLLLIGGQRTRYLHSLRRG